MKKLEEIAQGELTNANIIYEAYPRDYKEGIPEGGLVLTNRNCIYRFPWLEFVKNWHSDEEFQLLLRDRDTLKQGNDNLFKNHLELVRENDELKSQLKQQALPEIPEIPEFVAAAIERLKSEGIKTLCDFYNCDVDWMTFGMEDLRGDEFAVAKWFYHNTETFELAYSYGYTVAKEKRFYLKHIDMSKKYNSTVCVLAHGEGDVIYGHYEFPVGVFPSESDYIFTQSQIDSMETGSYEQIEVEE